MLVRIQNKVVYLQQIYSRKESNKTYFGRMNDVLMQKTAELVGAASSHDLLYKDYESISPESSSKDLNMHRVRGSVRLTMGKVVMPSDVAKLRKRVSCQSLI